MFDSGYRSKYMGGQKEKFVRLDDMNNSPVPMSANEYGKKKVNLQIPGLGKKKASKSFRLGVLKGSDGLKTFGRSLRTGVTKAVFPEDLKVSEKGIFDPQSKTLMYYNRIFELICIFSVSIDPLFFYVPIFNHSSYCIAIDTNLAKIAVLLRSICDCLYLFRIAIQFRTAFIAPSSRVFGRGELVIDPAQIAKRYLRRFFIVDLVSVLPLPQALVWRFINKTKGSEVYVTKQALLNVVILQYIPRFARFLPIFSDLKKAAGSVSSNALIGAAYYILWFMICSHVTGSIWYLLAVERNETCWRNACRQTPGCFGYFLYCGNKHMEGYQQWKSVSQDVLSKSCDVVDDESEFNYGIYKKAIGSKIVTIDTFIKKLCFCMWWGLQNLSTLGQGLYTSTYPGEILFSIIISIAGLTLFALLIGNVQMYLQSITVRLEEMRTKRRDSEQWMHHRLLPPELRERVRRYDQYKWLETRGVDEESLVKSLPKDLRRDIKRHLCLNLVRRVPLFANMDEQLLDAVCERLKPSLYTENTYIVREGDPVDEMLFVIRGRMESVTTDGGRSGFFNRGILKESDFCGDELLTWALDLKADSNLPLSTRTVRALTEVEAFALEAEELKFVASQFWRLHSRQVQHTFRFYSQQWRTWAASFIQAAWRRYAKRRAEKWRRELEGEDEYYYNESDDDDEDDDDNDERALVKRTKSSNKLKTTILASRFAANALRGRRNRSPSPGIMVPIQKPPEPDFTAGADI